MKEAFPIIIYLGIALIISTIPFIKVYFSIWNTLLLEIFRVCIAGKKNKVIRIKDRSKMMNDMEMLTFKEILHLYVGYTGTLFIAIGLFYLVAKQNYDFILYFLAGLLVISLLLWIRNLIGFIWGITCIILLAIPIYFNYEIVIMHIAILLSSVILVQSILQSLQEFRRSISNRKVYKSKGFLARLKCIQAMVFGLVLIGQSFYAGFFIAKTFLS